MLDGLTTALMARPVDPGGSW